MNIVWAVLVLGGLGAAFGALLAVAARVFAVETDTRLDTIIEALPGANCGGCGCASCASFAAALTDGAVRVTGCPVGGEAVIARLAEIMGVQMTKNTRLTAMVRCSGGVRARRKYEYIGIPDCVAAMRTGGDGPVECRYGCIGLGTCVEACPFGAISLVEGVAVVDHERCTGCMACLESCPKNIIVPVHYDSDVVVACSSRDKGAHLRRLCDIGCLGCRICERACTTGAIKVTDNLAAIDYKKCTGCGDCAEKCPRKLILDANLDRGARQLERVE